MVPVAVHTFATPLQDLETATVYAATAWAARREDGLWEGWLEFTPDYGGPLLVTDRETTQTSLGAVTYWATGLEPVYLEGAFQRALRRAQHDRDVA